MTSVQLTADYLPRISIFWLKKHGFLDCSRDGWYMHDNYKIEIITVIQDYHPYLYLIYVDSEGISSEAQKIVLVRTPCHYGGWRYWFQCPRPRNGMTCGRRYGVLYAYKGVFGCRICHNMTYSCRQTNTHSNLQEYIRAVKNERKFEKLYSKDKRWRYNAKPTKYNRQMRKFYKSLSDDSENEIDK